MMIAPRSLTQRILWALTGSVAVFVSALVVLAFMTFGRMEDELVNDVVRHETSRLAIQLQAGQDRLVEGEFLGLGDALRAWLVTDDLMPPSLPVPLRDLEPGMHELEPAGEVWHVSVEAVDRGRLVVVYDATDNEERVYDFGLIVLILGLVCVVAAYAVTRKIARLVIAPLHAVTDRLVLWAPGALDPAYGREDESARLIEAFNRVQLEVDRMIAAEREFSANLSHEVRTPLAAMRSDGEMMLLDNALAPAHRTRLERIIGNVDAVATALESARAVALDTPRMPSRVNLRECLEDAWYGMSARAQAQGLVLDDTIDGDVQAVVDRHALMTVLRNLIGNAIEHAAPATLTVSARGTALYLEDDGPGIAEVDLPHVFDRYFSGRRRDEQTTAEGSGATVAMASAQEGEPGLRGVSSLPLQAPVRRGLGLAIAKRVCDLHGWSLTAQSRQDGVRGVSFILALDIVP